MNDGQEPADSFDTSIPRFTWWDHKGTEEWVQYDFGIPTEVSGVEVYWFDEKDTADCKVPQRWELLCRDSKGQWHPVKAAGKFGTEMDKYNTIEFEAVATSALKIKVFLQSGYSGGILEWKVKE